MTANPRPATAMVLAAGLGTRMKPLTDSVPKPLVLLAGQPMIDHVLDRLCNAGITKAVVNVHYLADQIEEHTWSRIRPQVVISDERGMLLETGGGVVRALPLLGSEPFLIHNSESVWIENESSNLNRLIDAWDNARMDSLMLLASAKTSLGYDGRGDFFMGDDGRLTRQSGSHHAPFVFAGVSIAHPRLFENAPDGRFSLNVLWDRAIAARRVYGIKLDGLWMHVGTPEALDDANAAIARDKARASESGRT